jgi:hypothetical protein
MEVDVNNQTADAYVVEREIDPIRKQPGVSGNRAS